MTSRDTVPEPPTNPESGRSRGGALFWVVPALTFLVGLGLGALIVWLGTGGSGSTSAESSSSSGAGSSAATSSSPPTTITVPAECAQIADQVQAVRDDLAQAVTAIGALDTDAIGRALSDLQTRQAEISRLAESCRQVEVSPGASVAAS
jgi:hypothetical protein